MIDQNTKDLADTWRQFFDLLINTLQTNAGDEGLVAPSQPDTNTDIIQNNQLQNGAYTCQGGNILYQASTDPTHVIPDQLIVAILAPVTRIPKFYSINVTALP